MKIVRRFTFDAGHTLANHPGKCRRLHGHTYHLEVSIEAPLLDDQGMVMDFSHLKPVVQGSLDDLDHKFMIWEGDPRRDALVDLDPDSIVIMEMHPTAENIAEMLRNDIQAELPDKFVHVALWETPDCRAEI